MEQRKGPPIGIDLGTTDLRVSVYDGSKWRMIPDDHGYSSMPIYVAFTNSGLLVGEAAKKQAPNNPTNTIFDVTRLIGRRYSDPSVQNGIRLWPFQVKASPDDRLLVEVRWKSKLWQFTPVEILSMILMQMKENAQQNLGAIIKDAVITVPIHFNYKQRQAIKKAGMIAGLNFMQIISAPAASALFYGIEMQSQSSKTYKSKVLSLVLGEPEYNMIIYHVGAETLDVVVVTIKEHMCQVRATAGNVHLPRLDFNSTNVDHFVKILTDTCLKEANMDANMVDEVILADEFIRFPLLLSYIDQYFKRKELKVSEQLEEITAYGVAMQAFFCSVKDNKRVYSLSLCDITPFSLGIQCPLGKIAVCVPKNTAIPTIMKKRFCPCNGMTKLFEVYEDEQIIENNLLGAFELSTFPDESCKVNVSFQIHENGTLTVMAKDICSKIKNSITITDNNIQDSSKLVQEAFRYKENAKGKLPSMYKEPEEYAIGIDFGTTYSSVAVWQQNCVRVIENEYGSRLTYSAVAFTDTGRLIGDKVQREQATTDPENTIPNIKRLIGRCYDQSIQKDNESLPFKIQCDGKNRSIISVQYKNEEKLFAPEEIAATILAKMKEIVEAHLMTKVVTKAVVSVPACFSDSQRRAIKDAGDIAGLNVMQLLDEPTAAAIAYFLQKVSAKSSREKTLLIFDLGGGNLNVSIVTINEGTIRVQAVVGDTELGGEEFDNNMVCHFVEIMKEKERDISKKPTSLRRLRAACEKAKRVLSTIAETVVEIDALDKGFDFYSVITREEFEELNKSLFERSISCVKRCLEDAKMNTSRIDEVVLVGGSTRIPKMQQVLQEFFNGKELCQSMNPDEAIVYGAAVQAAILSGNDDIHCEKFNISELQDVTSLSFGLENNGSLSTEEIKEMKETADRYKKLDEENKARAVALNHLENLAYEVKAKARDPSVSASDKRALEEAADKVIEWLDIDHHAGIEDINDKKKQLENTKGKGKVIYLV
ncbi:uncharacterized protein LOC144548886 [Carex rostrata]